MNVDNLGLNKIARIDKINISNSVLRLRLLELGFIKNEPIIKLYKSPFNDPSIVEIHGYKIAISSNILKHIEVI